MSDAPLPDERLTLLGQDPADLPAISALLQDAALRLADMGFDRRARRLVLLVNRFRHESQVASRVRSALRIETVSGVQRQNWPAEPDTVLGLLALTLQDGRLHIAFSGGASLRCEIEVLELVLEDIGPPWPTTRIPLHRAND